MLVQAQFHMIAHTLIQLRVNIITKVFNLILDHPIRLIDPIQAIPLIIIINDKNGTNCGFVVSFWGV